MKKILVLCGCFPESKRDFYYEQSKGLPQTAADVLQHNIIKGFHVVTMSAPTVVTAPFLGYYPHHYGQLVIKSETVRESEQVYRVVGFVNIKGVETLMKARRLYRECEAWYRASEDNRIIFAYSHYAGFMSVIGKLKRKYSDIHVCCMVTDMPELSEQAKPKTIRQWLRRIPPRCMHRITYQNLSYVDSFVLLSKYMCDPLGVGERPYCVVEAICNDDEVMYESEKFSKTGNDTVFAYTGTLDRQYGIVELLKAFMQTKAPNFSLWICGDGNSRDDVLEAARTDGRIVYYGVLPHNETRCLQRQADILVNPRSDAGLFTKYSFPSKTLEYLTAGKPVVAYKLPGIPDDYDSHLFYIRNDDISGAMEYVGMLSAEERAVIGERNRAFALENKNFRRQVRRIYDMILDSNAGH